MPVSYYTLDEILIHYRDFKTTPGIIRILAEMACVSPRDMRMMLEKLGVIESQGKRSFYPDSSWRLLIEGIKKGYPVKVLCDQTGIRESAAKSWQDHANRLHISYDLEEIYRIRNRRRKQMQKANKAPNFV